MSKGLEYPGGYPRNIHKKKGAFPRTLVMVGSCSGNSRGTYPPPSESDAGHIRGDPSRSLLRSSQRSVNLTIYFRKR